MAEVGSKAPDFKLHDTDRNLKSLGDFSGKKALVFFPGAFTGVCTAEMCSFRDSMAEFNDMNASIIGISVDAPAANGGFAKVNNLEFPLLSDYKREAVAAYDVVQKDFAGLEGYDSAKRAIFLLDGDNTIKWKWVTDNPGVEPDYAEVKAELAKF